MTMKIASLQLEAFYETAQARSFSRAADHLGLTQSALSQRVAKLEDELEVTLFIRDPAGPLLTPAGEALLRHCQVTYSLEQEVLGQLKSSVGELRGVVRIAAYSSVLRSVIIPSLAEFLRAHPQVQCDFSSHEMSELPTVLRNAEADFIIMDSGLHKKGIAEHILGQEEFVAIESVKYRSPENLYLDHDADDTATETFFQHQAKAPKNFRRAFMGDVYGILNAAELGLGRAIMSRHLLKDNKQVRIIKGYKNLQREVTLHYFDQPYYSKLHQEIVKQLSKNVAHWL